MPRIGLISDTHGFLHPDYIVNAASMDEIWHAGDLGDIQILQDLQAAKKTRAVWGNIDDHSVRQHVPEDEFVEVDGSQVMISHIVGHPGRLHTRARPVLRAEQPDLVIYGHSHMLRLDYDKKTGALFINPGALGNHGGHLIRTAMQFTLTEGILQDVQVLEFGNRGAKIEGITKVVELGDWPLRNAKKNM